MQRQKQGSLSSDHFKLNINMEFYCSILTFRFSYIAIKFWGSENYISGSDYIAR